MRISIVPVCPVVRPPFTVIKAGDVLTINGEAFDFSALPDGGEIPADIVPCPSISGPVRRIGGKLHIALRLPCRVSDPHERRFPADIVDPADGPIAFPGD